MSEQVATWERVSSDGQTIENQTDTLERYCASRDYTVAKRFELPDTSAYKGKHQAALDEILRDVAAGEYTRVVAVTSSRFERRGVAVGLQFVLSLGKLGGRLEATDNPLFGDVTNLGGWIVTVASGDSDNQYSAKISDNVGRAFRRMDDQGAFRGAVPLGYQVAGEKYARFLEHDPQTAQQVRQAFSDATTGAGTVELGRALGLTPDAVAKLLRNPTYSTGQYQVQRSDGVTSIHKCPPLIHPDIQQAAIAALNGRRTGDNVTSRAIRKEDFSGAVYCPCGYHAGMYRYYGGGKKRKDGSPTPRVRRYRCGGCGKSVNAEHADRAVREMMSSRTAWWLTRELIPGNDSSAELARIGFELRELAGRGLSDDREDAERARLRAERRRLEAEPQLPSHWDTGFKKGPDGELLTEADRWKGLDNQGRRALLTSGEFKVLVQAKPGRTGAVAVGLVFNPELDES